MKLLYYMAVAKPRKSKLYLPVMRRGITILGGDKETVMALGQEALPDYIGPRNRFQDPADWIVRAAKVMVAG